MVLYVDNQFLVLINSGTETVTSGTININSTGTGINLVLVYKSRPSSSLIFRDTRI